jgi:hypothetical protein
MVKRDDSIGAKISAGRTRKYRTRLAELSAMNVSQLFPDISGRQKKQLVRDAVLLGLLRQGIRGNVSAANAVIEQHDGPQKREVEVSGISLGEILALADRVEPKLVDARVVESPALPAPGKGSA